MHETLTHTHRPKTHIDDVYDLWINIHACIHEPNESCVYETGMHHLIVYLSIYHAHTEWNHWPRYTYARVFEHMYLYVPRNHIEILIERWRIYMTQPIRTLTNFVCLTFWQTPHHTQSNGFGLCAHTLRDVIYRQNSTWSRP